jgi:hypothetical protein
MASLAAAVALWWGADRVFLAAICVALAIGWFWAASAAPRATTIATFCTVISLSVVGWLTVGVVQSRARSLVNTEMHDLQKVGQAFQERAAHNRRRQSERPER